jgi:hypothetical protein
MTKSVRRSPAAGIESFPAFQCWMALAARHTVIIIAYAGLATATRFPIDGLDSLWNPEVTNQHATRERLRALGYRYVVWHKHVEMFEGRPAVYPSRSGAPASSDRFIRETFQGERPVQDDELVTVFRL